MFAFVSVNVYLIVCCVVLVVFIGVMVWASIVSAIPDEISQEEMQRCHEQCREIKSAQRRASDEREPKVPSPEYLCSIRKPSTN